MADLREGLLSLQIESRGAREHKPFYSPSHVKELLTLDRIRAHVATSIPSLSSSPHDLHLYSSLIHRSSTLIYAVLLLTGHEKYILEFLYRREADSRLFYTLDGLYFLPDVVARDFFNRQCELRPVCLKKGEIHRELGPHDVLPFLDDVEIGEGGFAKVYKVRLEPTCQELVAEGEVCTRICVFSWIGSRKCFRQLGLTRMHAGRRCCSQGDPSPAARRH
jgi:hypothetical protein